MIFRKHISCSKIHIVLLSAVFTLLGCFSVLAQNTTTGEVTINVKNQPVESVFKQISDQINIKFFYGEAVISNELTVSIDMTDSSLEAVLSEITKQTQLQFNKEGNTISVSNRSNRNQSTPSDSQQSKNIAGIVSDQDGIPIIGANVIVKGTTNGTITGLDGDFNLEVPEGALLVISYIGYTSKEIPVKGENVYNIELTEDSKALGEVVVTALGIKREEKALGYSVQSVVGDELTKVKGTEIGTSLSGKIAGVNVQNSSEFNSAPKILIRGKEPLIVIDGVPYGNIGLGEIAPDNVENISVLKGSTASALYGYRGKNGAIMITTKRGKGEGLDISVNSNTMFAAGYLKIPKAQSSYSTGTGSKYNAEDFVWGDKLDIGRTAVQYNPHTYEWEEMPLVSKGKNNFENFLENSFITNNNVSVTYKGPKGSFRTSLTHVYNKGQYPNLKLNRFNYTVSGETKWNNLTLDGSASYNKRYYPQGYGSGYGATGYIYNMLVWTGTDFDIRDYKNNYWKKGREQEEQNWWSPVWYDNPYFMAYERTYSNTDDRFNGHFNVTYEFAPWIRTTARAGIDAYSIRDESKTPKDTRGDKKGAYTIRNYRGMSVNGDLIAIAEHSFGDINLDGMLGSSIYFYEDNGHESSTSNGLLIPGYYSLKASVDKATTSSSVSKRQTNSLYGKIGASWKSALFLEVTGRNDWVSTLASSERSYFYPSVSGSVIMSEFLTLPSWFDFWKLRSSWTMAKDPADNYVINQVYAINTNVWDNLNGAEYPDVIRGATLRPQSTRSFEAGTVFNFLKNRLSIDIAYYQTLLYDIQRYAPISETSGFSTTLINIDEEQIRKGWEVTVSGEVIRTKDFSWSPSVNWARDRYYYHKVDPEYSTDRPWVANGKRWDWMADVYDWERDPQGNIIHINGMPQKMKYDTSGYYEYPDWIWGFVNDFKYKNFTLSFTFDGRVGGYGYNQTTQAMWNSGSHPDSDNEWRYDEVVNGKKNYIGKGVQVVSGSVQYNSYGQIISDDRVFAPNDKEVSYEQYTSAYQPWSGTAAIQNIKEMTFFKLRELTIGYTLPSDFSKRMGIKNAHLALVAQNLWMWSKNFKYSDPDVSSDKLNSPSVRYIGVNIKLDL